MPRPPHDALTRRRLTQAALGAAGATLWPPAWAAPETAPAASGDAGDAKVLRYAFRVAESSFDPAQITDAYSRTVAANIYDAPLRYAFLARPPRLQPNTAAAMPTVSADFKTYTLRIRPGIFFADDPAFGGRRRELTAEDYVYAVKRHYDPRWKSGNLYLFESAGLLGLSAVRQRALDSKQAFDYDQPVDGVRAPDRYTLEFRLDQPSPRFLQLLADGSVTGAVAREVVERHGDKIGEHPVGTGPFRLAQWVRSSRMVLERNPNYRDEFYDEDPPPGDALAVAAHQRLKGRKLPIVDRVEISIVEENQPRWLAYLRGDMDVLWEVPSDFASLAMPNNRLAPNLARQGMTMVRYARPDVSYSYFAMENPVVGGYTPDKVALRRAISLAVDIDTEMRLLRRGQAVPAQSSVAPGTWGYDPEFKSEMSTYSVARSRALLDLYGYVDRDGDGWRELPDGRPLVLEMATQPDDLSRQADTLWKKNLDAIGLRLQLKPAKWPENLKASRAGKLMMWNVGWLANDPDADTFLAMAYGPNAGQANHCRFNLPAFNALYERQRALPNGPERQKLIDEAKRLMIAYMPFRAHVHRIATDLAQPWVIGYHRNNFVRDFWRYVDVDMAARRKALG